MAAADGPTHGPEVRAVISAWYEFAVDCRAAANSSQAIAAASIGPDPGPAYIRAELTSGGSTAKSMSFSSDRFHGCGSIDGCGARRMGVASRAANKSQSL
jgi:hypothetical protein